MASEVIFKNIDFQDFVRLQTFRNKAVINFKNSNCQKSFVRMDQFAWFIFKGIDTRSYIYIYLCFVLLFLLIARSWNCKIINSNIKFFPLFQHGRLKS
jgi:hypothetical protein